MVVKRGFAVALRWVSKMACVLGLLAPGLTLAQMPVVELGMGMFRIEAEVAHTDPNRQLGLMNRKAMAVNRGMVFVFTQQAQHCMWMKNTFIPLSVAFIDGRGRILNIEDMAPHSEVSHCAVAPAKFALEMNQGWFRERGFKPGDVIRGVERLPAAR